jgi:NitT/TauT family transport system substrate-binding protein
MKRVKQSWYIWAIALWATFLLSACQNNKGTSQEIILRNISAAKDSVARITPEGGELRPFVFTPQWTPQAQFAGYYVAKELGFYHEAGLDVTIEHPNATYSAISRIRNSESDATTLQLVQALEIIDNGIPMVNTLQTSMNNGMALVSRNNENPLTQHGARVGIWSAGFDQIPICMNIKEELGYNWIRIASNINPFLVGAVDIICVMTYNEYNLLKQAGIELNDENTFKFKDSDYNIQEDGVYMKRDNYLQHQKEAEAFAQASRKGWEWSKAHKEEALEIVMQYVAKENIATNRVIQRLMLEEIIHLQLDQKTGEQPFTLRRDMVESAVNILHENGLIQHEIDYEELIP